jgi:hypothetical protein
MNRIRRTLLLPFALVAGQCFAADVHVLDIDRVGADALATIKASPTIRAWAEIGDMLVVEAAPGFAQGALQSRVIETLPVAGLSQLATRVLVHCNGDEPGHDKHAATALFERSHWQLVADASKRAGDETLYPGRVVSWQQDNRAAKNLAVDPAIAAVVASVNIDNWRRAVDALAAFNRQSETGYSLAANFLETEFNALGLTVSRQAFDPPVGVPASGRSFNVLGLQPGNGHGLLIVGAHMDSRNQTFNDALPSPGAEDNGSGCAAVVETARTLRGRRFDADILYICYGLEERGLHGGRAHANAQTPSQVLGVINMDMIAYDGDSRLDVSLQTTAAGLGLQQRLADNAARYANLEVELATQTCCSDHQPYLDRGIPAVLLIENDYRTYPQYHTSSDTADRLSNAMAREILKMAVATAAEVAGLRAGQRYNGYWFDPAQSGHGFHLEAQDSGHLFLTWYTFDAAGNRLWVTANGQLQNNTSTLSAQTVSGGAFPPAFNAANISVAPWGSFQITFTDCSHATIAWTPLPATGLPAGTMNAVRASDPQGGGCID